MWNNDLIVEYLSLDSTNGPRSMTKFAYDIQFSYAYIVNITFSVFLL